MTEWMFAGAFISDADRHAGFRVRVTPLRGSPKRKQARIRGLLVLQVGIGGAISTPLARQIENAVDCPNRGEGAGGAALEYPLACPVVADPALIAGEHMQDRELHAVRRFRMIVAVEGVVAR